MAFVAACFVISSLTSGAVDYIEPDTEEIQHGAKATALAAAATPHEAPEASQELKEPPKATEQPKPTAEPTEEPAPTEPEYQTIIGSRDWDAEESRILLKIAMAEAEGESVEGKALVMLVVLNRVWSSGFPNTIEDVVFQERQFSPTVPGGRYWTTEPNEECYEALDLVLSGWDISNGALYFESCKGDSWHSRNLELVLEYGNHRFYK